MNEPYRRPRGLHAFNEPPAIFDDQYFGPGNTTVKEFGYGRQQNPPHHDLFHPNMGHNMMYSQPLPIPHRGNPEKNEHGPNIGQSPSADKRFKSLPDAEALPRSETLGGYIFVCNNDTMEENLKRQLFGLPSRYRDSVRAIQPGLPLFLYNYSTHQLHGVFEATSFGGTNIDPSAWEDKKTPGESRFPAQVRARVRRRYRALDEELFRPLLFHYDGPKFRLQLSVPEVLALLDLFVQRDGPETPSIDESPIGSVENPESPFKFE